MIPPASACSDRTLYPPHRPRVPGSRGRVCRSPACAPQYRNGWVKEKEPRRRRFLRMGTFSKPFHESGADTNVLVAALATEGLAMHCSSSASTNTRLTLYHQSDTNQQEQFHGVQNQARHYVRPNRWRKARIVSPPR